MLENEAHGVREAAQGQVFLVLDGQGVEDLLLDHREGILHIIHRVVHHLGKLGNELSLGKLLGLRGVWILAIAQSIAGRWNFLRLIR